LKCVRDWDGQRSWCWSVAEATRGGGGADAGFDPELPGINGTGTFLDESVRIATINTAKVAQAAGGATQPLKDAAMIAHLLTDPNIEAAAISDLGQVWARFIDGTLYIDFSARDADFDGVRASRFALRIAKSVCDTASRSKPEHGAG